jgi:hypothetical protein
VGSFLQGILEIAGTSSPFTIGFYVVGLLFAVAGLVLLIYNTQVGTVLDLRRHHGADGSCNHYECIGHYVG